MNFTRTDWKVFLAVAITIVSWSSAWVSVRVAVQFYTPGQLALGRYLVALCVLVPLLLWRRPRFALRDWPLIWVAGACGFTLYNLLINTGEKTITAGAAALIASTIPILTTLGAQLFLGERVRALAWAGSAVALGGVAIIAWGESGGIQVSKGALLVLGAAFCAAIYGLIQKQLVARYSALDVTAAAICAGVLILIPFGGGLTDAARVAPFNATAHLIILGLFPGALGYVLWTWCFGQMPVARLMLWLYLVAPLSVLMAWVFLGELPSLVTLLGGVVTLAGVVWARRVSD